MRSELEDKQQKVSSQKNIKKLDTHTHTQKMSCRDLWDNNRRVKICIIGQRPLSMSNGKLLKETQFDKALYFSDHKDEKKNRIVDSVKLISGAMSRCLYGTI